MNKIMVLLDGMSKIVFLLLALVCFILNAIWLPSSFNLLGFGLVFLTAYFLINEFKKDTSYKI